MKKIIALVSKRNVACFHQSAELYGSDRSFLSSVSAIAKTDGYDVDVFIASKGPLEEKLKSIPVQYSVLNLSILRKGDVSKHPFSFIYNFCKVVFRLRKNLKNCSIVYVNTIVCLSVVVSLFGKSNVVKIIHIREIPKRATSLVFSIVIRACGFRCIFNSLQTREAFPLLEGVVIQNGVPDNAESEHNKKNHLNRSITKILVIGRISEWKGQIFLLESLIERAETKPRISLDIVGDVYGNDKPLSEKLYSLTAKLRMKSNIDINLTGFVDDTTPFYQEADVVLVPSIRPEPFGRIAIEAFCHSVPVIAANHGGLSDIVEHGKNGLLFNPSDAQSLNKCLQSFTELTENEFLKFRASARDSYERKYTEKIYQEKIVEFFDNL